MGVFYVKKSIDADTNIIGISGLCVIRQGFYIVSDELLRLFLIFCRNFKMPPTHGHLKQPIVGLTVVADDRMRNPFFFKYGR